MKKRVLSMILGAVLAMTMLSACAVPAASSAPAAGDAIILSMTKYERANAEQIDMPRRRRIAKGSGRSVEEVSQLIKQFLMMKKVMKNNSLLDRMAGGMGGMRGGFGGGMGGFGGMGGMGGFGGGMGGFRMRGSNYTPPKKKRRKK